MILSHIGKAACLLTSLLFIPAMSVKAQDLQTLTQELLLPKFSDMTPEAASEFEQNNYMPDERIPIEVLKANYEKYFSKEKRKEIHQLLKL